MSRLWVKDVKVSTCIHNSKVTDLVFLNDWRFASRLIYLWLIWVNVPYIGLIWVKFFLYQQFQGEST